MSGQEFHEIPFEDLSDADMFEMMYGVHPDTAYLNVCKEGGFPEYCMEFGKYDMLAMLAALLEYFAELEDYRKCAEIRPLKAGILEYLYKEEFPNEEE
jgi:hypothetical protein